MYIWLIWPQTVDLPYLDSRVYESPLQPSTGNPWHLVRVPKQPRPWEELRVMSLLVPLTIVVGATWIFWRTLRGYLVKSSLDNIPGPPNTSFWHGTSSSQSDEIIVYLILVLWQVTFFAYITVMDGTLSILSPPSSLL